MGLALADKADRSATVTTKAFLKAGDLLGVSNKVLGEVVGTSEATLSRLRHGQALIGPATKTGELALLFIRLFRSLDALLGGNNEKCRDWLHAENSHLNGRPIELIQTAQGLVRVAEYLDAMRG